MPAPTDAFRALIKSDPSLCATQEIITHQADGTALVHIFYSDPRGEIEDKELLDDALYAYAHQTGGCEAFYLALETATASLVAIPTDNVPDGIYCVVVLITPNK